jgi:RNA polymerase sigma-70 factor (sigma-E family)
MRSGREPPPGARAAGQGARAADQEARAADQAMTALYQTYYRLLVRLAALLVADLATAEEIVQDSFAAVHERWHVLPDTEAALTYLRRSVIRQCRSATRLSPARGTPARGTPDGGRPTGRGTGSSLPGSDVVSALRALPARQREVMVLRYFAELSEAEIASATGMSPAAVRSHTARAMASLTRWL